MAEETNEVIDIPTGDGIFSTVPIISFEKSESDELVKIYGADKAESAIAENVAQELSLDFPNVFNYKQLKDGTAPLFNFSPETKDLAPADRSMTDRDILDQFSNLKNVGFFEGLTREVTKMAPSAAGTLAGFKLGAKLTAPIPPVNPLAIAVKYGVPVITGAIGAFGGFRVGDEFSDLLLGEEKAVTPSQSAAYEAGKTVGGGLAWLPMPFMVPKTISMGASTYLDNLGSMILKDPKKSYLEGFPEVSGKIVDKFLKTGKGPKTARFARSSEQLLGKIGTEFSKRPKTMAAAETVSVVGAGSGAYVAESSDPGAAGTRFALEMAGGILPQVGFTQLIKYIPQIRSTIKEAGGFKNYFKEGFQSAARGFGENRQLSGTRRILEILETQGDDVDALIKALNDKDIVDIDGKPLDLTSAQKTGNTTLMAIENSIAQSTEGLAKQAREKNKLANKAIRNVIFALKRTGQPELLIAAAKLQEGRFNQYLTQKLANSTDRLLEARSRLKGDNPKGNRELSASIFELAGTQLNKARDEEKRLYRDIGNLEITSFLNSQGNPTDKPNFIKYFENVLPKTPEAKAEFLKDLGSFQNFVNRKKIELGLEEVTSGTTSNRVAEFDKVIEAIKAKGVQPRRTDNLVLNEVDLARKDLEFGELEELDAGQLTTLLERIRSKPPENLNDVFRKGQTQEARRDRTKIFNNQKARHKDALNLVNTYRQRKIEQTSTLVSEGVDELKPLTVTEIRDMRSLALSKGKALMASGEASKARVAYGFAESLLDDLNGAPEGLNAAFDTARGYSKALNDVYTRAFAGNVLAKSKTGAQRQSPELLHKNLMTADADVSYLRIKQIEDIGNFAKEQGIDGAEETISTINGTIDSILRNARSEAFTEMPDGQVVLNQKKLQAWMVKNEELLETFPNLKADLQDTTTANNLLSGWVTKGKNIQKNIKNQITYRNITEQANPVEAVLKAYNHRYPIKALNSLIKPVRGNPEALAGLKSSVLEWALTKGGKTSESFSPREVYQTLYTKIPKVLDDTSIMDHMLRNDVINKSESGSLKKLLTEMIKLEASEVAGTLDTLENAGPILDFYLRVTGSALGTRMQALIPGQSGSGALVAAGAGSKALRRIFQDIPASMKTDVMTEVMSNPKLLATLLKKAQTDPEKLKLSKRLGQIFTEAGFFVTGGRQTIIRAAPSAIRAIETEEYDPIAEEQPIREQSSVQPGIAKGTPTTQLSSNEPFLSGLNTAPAGGGTSSAAPANPNQRSQYASLFPNDIISGMIQPTATMAEGGAVPPREVDIKGQPHMLAYITPKEGGILQLMGGSGRPGPMGIPSFYSNDAQASTEGPGDGPSDSDFGGFSNYSPVDNNTISNQEDLGSGRYGVTQVAFSKGPKAGQTVSIYGRNSQKQTDSRRDAESIRDAMMNNNNPNVNKMNLFTVNKNPVTRGLQKTSIYGPKGPNVDTIQSLIDSINVQNARDAKDAAQQPSLMDSLMSGINIGNVNVSPGMVGTGYGVNFGTTFAKGGSVQDEDDVQDYSDVDTSQSMSGDYTGSKTSGMDDDVKAQVQTSMAQRRGVSGIGDLGVTPSLYMKVRGATNTNPFPNSIASQLGRQFGFNVDYTKQYGGGAAGRQRVAEINQLRYDQAFDPDRFKAGDFELGASTTLGPVGKKPSTSGIAQLMQNAPYIGSIMKMFPKDTLPYNHPEMIKARKAAAMNAKKPFYDIF